MASASPAMRRLLRDNNQFGLPGMLTTYRPGDPALGGETFTGNNIRTYFDVNGLLQTAGTNVKRDGHYIAGTKTLLMELPRTNVVIQNRDLTNVAWTKTSCTAAKDQIGLDGAANSASSLLATGANATCLQAIVLGSSARYQSAYLKRITGVGNIDMTMDNGVTWTTVALTGAFTKLVIPTQTLANPTVGFRIVTSGDKIAVDFVQNENGVNDSSPIATAAASVARTSDLFSSTFILPPQAQTLYAKIIEQGTIGLSASKIMQLGDAANPRLIILASAAGFYEALHHNGTTQVLGVLAAAPVKGDTVELRLVLFADGSVQCGQSVNGAAETVSARSAANAVNAAWSATHLWIGSESTASQGITAFQAVKISVGIRTMGEMRAG